MTTQSAVKKIIGVASGKGGVGKTLVTSLLAVLANRAGLRTAILDADITGPSIPRAFGLEGKAESSGGMIIPAVTASGIRVMSVNLLLGEATDPVLWRGPVITKTLRRFWSGVAWGELDCMFVDLPPGTGDVPLTVYQTLPMSGIVVVTSPQELVGMIVEKAVKMAEKLRVPPLALVENMSYYKCPDCGAEHSLFGASRAEETAERLGIPAVCRLPLDPALSSAADAGAVERLDKSIFAELCVILDIL